MSKEKKFLVLVMSCNLPNYQFKEQIIRDTWFDVAKNHPNCNGCYFFTASAMNRYKLDEENDIIYVPVPDMRDRTFNKFIKTILFIDKIGIEYDYIVRLNIQTYPNIRLIDKFIQSIEDETDFFCGTMCNSPWFKPVGLPFCQGEFFIMSKYNLDILKNYYIDEIERFNHIERHASDDNRFYNDDGWVTYILYNHYVHKYNFDVYINKVHSLGIVHEVYDKLKSPDKYNKVLCINYKTETSDLNGLDLDALEVYDDTNKKKIEQIHKIISQELLDESESIDYIWKNIDNHCYDIQQVEKGTRFFDSYTCNKTSLVTNFKILMLQAHIQYTNMDSYMHIRKKDYGL